MAGLALIGTLNAIMFFWIYCNRKKIPSSRKARSGLAAPRPSGALSHHRRRSRSDVPFRDLILTRSQEKGEIFQSSVIASAGSLPTRDAWVDHNMMGQTLMSAELPENFEIIGAGQWFVSCPKGSIYLTVNRPATVKTSDIPWQLVGATDKLIIKRSRGFLQEDSDSE
jgi:hypothetical protein